MWLLVVPCAGGIVAPFNYRWSAEEASEAVGLVGPRFFVCDESCLGWCDVFKQRHEVIDFLILISTSPRADKDLVDAEVLIQSAGPKPELVLRHAPNGITLICFTSGTMRRLKEASISHDAIVIQSLAKLAVVGYSAEDVFVHSAPTCHIGGISFGLAMVIAVGCQVFLPKFKATAMITVPVTSVVCSAGRGMNFLSKCDDHSQRCWRDDGSLLFHDLQTYPRRLHSGGHSWKTRHSPPGGVCVGKPAPHAEMVIRTKGGSVGGLLVEGNVLTRGPHVMSFYWGDPQQTATA